MLPPFSGFGSFCNHFFFYHICAPPTPPHTIFGLPPSFRIWAFLHFFSTLKKNTFVQPTPHFSGFGFFLNTFEQHICATTPTFFSPPPIFRDSGHICCTFSFVRHECLPNVFAPPGFRICCFCYNRLFLYTRSFSHPLFSGSGALKQKNRSKTRMKTG